MERHQRKNCPVKLQCEECPQSFSKFRQLKKHRSLCAAERSDQAGFGGDNNKEEHEEDDEEELEEDDEEELEEDDEEELVTNFIKEEEALAELEEQLRDLEKEN